MGYRPLDHKESDTTEVERARTHIWCQDLMKLTFFPLCLGAERIQ